MSRSFGCFVALLALSGCAALLNPGTAKLARNLSAATLNHPDPETVRQGAPAFLLTVDGLIEGDPENVELLLAGSRLYRAYVAAFADDPGRARLLANRALGYAHRALCSRRADLCEATARPFDEFVPVLSTLRHADLDVLYIFGTAWAGWVQTRSDDWDALAQLPKIEACFERVLEFEESHDGGNAHLYLAVLNTQRPASMGGRPDLGRTHFERAIELSGGRNLLAKVLFAKQYARLVFDQELHDRLLKEVLAADPEARGLTLSNVLAQQQALELLGESKDYF